MRGKMTKLFMCLLAVLLLSGRSAQAAGAGEDGFYTRFDAAYAAAPDRADWGYVLRAGFGKRRNDHFRTEFMLTRHRHELDGIRREGMVLGASKGRVSAMTALANVYWDIFTWKGVTPYIGAGVGVSRNKMTDIAIYPAVLKGTTKFRLAGQVGAGVGIALPKNLELDLGWTYMDMGNFETKASYNPWMADSYHSARREDIRSHEFHIGLRYNF